MTPSTPMISGLPPSLNCSYLWMCAGMPCQRSPGVFRPSATNQLCACEPGSQQRSAPRAGSGRTWHQSWIRPPVARLPSRRTTTMSDAGTALLSCWARDAYGALALVSCGWQSQATEGRGVGEISLQCSLQLPAVVLQRLLRRPLAAQARARAEPPPQPHVSHCGRVWCGSRHGDGGCGASCVCSPPPSLHPHLWCGPVSRVWPALGARPNTGDEARCNAEAGVRQRARSCFYAHWPPLG
eukprot:SAG25_NODE_1503_length_2882_cov_1.547251_2_plen_240_part_00